MPRSTRPSDASRATYNLEESAYPRLIALPLFLLGIPTPRRRNDRTSPQIES